jgi:hypothetical protein
MREPFQLPSVNALVSADKDVLRTMFQQLVVEVNRLRREVESLSAQTRPKGY